MDDEVLTGGNWTAVVRRGGSVHRTAGPWTPTIHRLLEHLHARGTTALPRPLGHDEVGREVLTHLPGTVPTHPLPPWVWTDEVLVDSARLLARVHAASAGFDASGGVWQLPAREPAEVVRLNDVSPHNTVFDDDHRVTGFIDVDTASPGPRADDLAHLGHRLVPLTAADDSGAGVVALPRARRRLELLCTAYASDGDEVAVAPAAVVAALATRLTELADLTAARAAAGAAHVAAHVQGYRDDAAWVIARAGELVGATPPPAR